MSFMNICKLTMTKEIQILPIFTDPRVVSNLNVAVFVDLKKIIVSQHFCINLHFMFMFVKHQTSAKT